MTVTHSLGGALRSTPVVSSVSRAEPRVMTRLRPRVMLQRSPDILAGGLAEE